MVYSNRGSSYGVSTAANDCASLLIDSNLTTLMAPSSWPNSTAPTCTSNGSAGGTFTGYAMYHALVSSASTYACVDSTGMSTTTTTALSAGKNCSGASL